MARWTVYGGIAIGGAHFAFPGFRRQTWALKAFLLSSATIFGLCIGADDHLFRFEAEQRKVENDVRRQARNALAKEGVIATEGEIRRWKREQDAAAAATRAAPAPSPALPTSAPPPGP